MNDYKRAAYKKLNLKRNVLAPEPEAIVTFPAYDPCRAVRVVAVVAWPATVSMRNVTLYHVIREGDTL
jgi:hypothetical protein